MLFLWTLRRDRTKQNKNQNKLNTIIPKLTDFSCKYISSQEKNPEWNKSKTAKIYGMIFPCNSRISLDDKRAVYKEPGSNKSTKDLTNV